MPSPLALNPDLNFHLRKIESPQIEIGITIEPRKSEGMAKKSSVRNGTIIFTRSNSADFTKTPRSKQILLDLFFQAVRANAGKKPLTELEEKDGIPKMTPISRRFRSSFPFYDPALAEKTARG